MDLLTEMDKKLNVLSISTVVPQNDQPVPADHILGEPLKEVQDVLVFEKTLENSDNFYDW